jgi:hypothetical protein
MGIRDLRILTLIVAAMVTIEALSTPIILLAAELFPDGYMENVVPIASQVDLAVTGFTLLTYAVFSRWIYVAGRNLLEAGYQDLEFTPGSRIWWFAVPFANLVKPYQGMRELWNASHGESDYTIGNGLVGAWWALWLGHGFLATILRASAETDAGTGSLWLQSAADIAVAIVAILMLRRIAEAQTKLGSGELAEVFA